MYVDHEDGMFDRIVGGVYYIIKQQPWIVAVLPVFKTKNVFRITTNRKREGSRGTM